MLLSLPAVHAVEHLAEAHLAPLTTCFSRPATAAGSSAAPAAYYSFYRYCSEPRGRRPRVRLKYAQRTRRNFPRSLLGRGALRTAAIYSYSLIAHVRARSVSQRRAAPVLHAGLQVAFGAVRSLHRVHAQLVRAVVTTGSTRESRCAARTSRRPWLRLATARYAASWASKCRWRHLESQPRRAPYQLGRGRRAQYKYIPTSSCSIPTRSSRPPKEKKTPLLWRCKCTCKCIISTDDQ